MVQCKLYFVSVVYEEILDVLKYKKKFTIL